MDLALLFVHQQDITVQLIVTDLYRVYWKVGPVAKKQVICFCCRSHHPLAICKACCVLAHIIFVHFPNRFLIFFFTSPPGNSIQF